MSLKQFYPFKDFQSDQIQRSSHKIVTAHYACRKTDLNLTLITGMIGGFIFQKFNSLIESWEVRLTCLDCKHCMKKKNSQIFLFNILDFTTYQIWMSSQNPGCITSQTGHAITLFCYAPDDEITVFKWTKGGRVVSNESSGVLNVPISSSDDFGVYTCHAMNKYGVTSYNITVCQNKDHVGLAPEGICSLNYF